MRDARAWWGVDVESDHAVVVARVRLRFCVGKRRVVRCALRLDKLRDGTLVDTFRFGLQELDSALREGGLTAEKMWEQGKRVLLEAWVKARPCRPSEPPWLSAPAERCLRELELARAACDVRRERVLRGCVRERVRADRQRYWEEMALKLEEAGKGATHERSTPGWGNSPGKSEKGRVG